MLQTSKKPSGTLGGCLRLSVYGRLSLVIKLFEFTGKSSNSKQYRKMIQEDSERSYNKYILFKIAAAACHESGFWRVHLSARLPQCAEHAIL